MDGLTALAGLPCTEIKHTAKIQIMPCARRCARQLNATCVTPLPCVALAWHTARTSLFAMCLVGRAHGKDTTLCRVASGLGTRQSPTLCRVSIGLHGKGRSQVGWPAPRCIDWRHVAPLPYTNGKDHIHTTKTIWFLCRVYKGQIFSFFLFFLNPYILTNKIYNFTAILHDSQIYDNK